MIQLSHHTRILLATQPADFRKGIDGLVALCRGVLEQDPRSGTYFVFINRSRTMIRVLVYDGSGYWLMTKRLSKARFVGWPTVDTDLSAMAATQLRVLLSGQNPCTVQRIEP